MTPTIGTWCMVCVVLLGSFVLFEAADAQIVSSAGTNYGAWCDASPLDAPLAQSRCVSKDSGWTLASIPTSGVDAITRGLKTVPMWTGGTFEVSANKYMWQYGRHAGTYFTNAPGAAVMCVTGMYCNWAPGEPNRADCGDGSPLEKDVITGWTASQQWDDMWANGCGSEINYKIYCYVCEQSPCLQTDCGKGYSRPRGYYPSCTCSTNSATLSLTNTSRTTPTATISDTVPLTATKSLQLTTSLSLSKSPTTSITSTMSHILTRSITITLSPSVSESLSSSVSITPITTQTASLHSSLSTTHTVSEASSISSSATTSFPQSTTVSDTSTQKQSTSISLSYLSPSTTRTSTHTPFPTTTMTELISATGLTQISTHTEEHTNSSTYAANTTLVAQMLARFPLFTNVIVDDDTVRSGLTRSLTPTHNSTALWELLSEAGARRVTGIPIVAAVPALGPIGVTGNEGGFFRTQPNTTLLMPNSTTLDITMSALSQYSITVGERLLLYTSMRELLDVSFLTDHRDVDELHLVGTIVVSKGDTGMSGPSIVTTVVTGGALGGMASELQGVGALALMGCSDPNTKSSFGSYRVLSPVAVQDSYAGVIMGNVLLTGAVGVVQLGIVLVLRFCRRAQRAVEQMATARFPSLFIAAALAFHTGTAFASAQLISQPDNFAGWEVFVGVAGFVYSLVLPVVMAAHPYLRVGRAYQEYNIAKWLGARRWPTWIAWVVPRGALFSLETRQAYGLYLSAYRAPPRQLFWTSLPTWTPLVFLVAGLFHPTKVPGCRAQFACMGIAMVVIAVLVVWRAPLRSHMAGWLDAASRLTLGCVMCCMCAAIVDGDKVNAQASDAAYAFIVVLMAITALRVLHHLLCMYTDYHMERDAVPLEMVWTHVLGGNKKKTLQFHNMEDDSLRGIAGDRDEAGDADNNAMKIDMPLVDDDTSDDDSVADHGDFNNDEDYERLTDEEEFMDVEVEDDELWASDCIAAASTTPSSRPQYSGIATFQDNNSEGPDNNSSGDGGIIVDDNNNNTPALTSPLSLLESSSSSSSFSQLTPNDDNSDDDISLQSI